MMKIEEVRSELLQNLSPSLGAQGFAIRKADSAFVRKKSDLTHIFWVNVLPWSGWIGVKSSALVGCSEIIRHFNEILGRKLKSSEAVCGFGLRNKFPDRGNYQVNAQEEVPQVAEKLRQDFEEVALPFFDQIDSLGAIDRLMNAPDEGGRYKPESVDRACMALIAAKLANNPAFPRLAEAYFDFCREAQSVALARPILKVRDHFHPQSGPSALQAHR